MTTDSEPWPPDGTRFRARWIVPVDGEPVANGFVEIADGRIVAIDDRAADDVVDLGRVAIVPSFVNAHTHLEFSNLLWPLEPSEPFTEWIRRLVGHRAKWIGRLTNPRAKSSDGFGEIVFQGLDECLAAGTSAVGEIATDYWDPGVFAADRPRAVVFRELIGLSKERAEQQLAVAGEHLGSGRDGEPFVRGLSPHAPYSVHPDLYRALVALAAKHAAPLAIHLAETLAELELLERGTGEFRTMLEEFGVWNPEAFARSRRPLDLLEPLAELDRALVVHGNHLSPDELAFLGERPRLHVVYCPRTHDYFGHPRTRPHPWRELLDAGGSVCLGTDSRASNPDLSLFREMQFLRSRFPDVMPRRILELGTAAGARALGLDDEFGSLAVGRPAHLAVVALPPGADGDPFAALLAADSAVVASAFAGTWSRDRG